STTTSSAASAASPGSTSRSAGRASKRLASTSSASPPATSSTSRTHGASVEARLVQQKVYTMRKTELEKKLMALGWRPTEVMSGLHRRVWTRVGSYHRLAVPEFDLVPDAV